VKQIPKKVKRELNFLIYKLYNNSNMKLNNRNMMNMTLNVVMNTLCIRPGSGKVCISDTDLG